MMPEIIEHLKSPAFSHRDKLSYQPGATWSGKSRGVLLFINDLNSQRSVSRPLLLQTRGGPRRVPIKRGISQD